MPTGAEEPVSQGASLWLAQAETRPQTMAEEAHRANEGVRKRHHCQRGQ